MCRVTTFGGNEDDIFVVDFLVNSGWFMVDVYKRGLEGSRWDRRTEEGEKEEMMMKERKKEVAECQSISQQSVRQKDSYVYTTECY